MLQLHPMMEEFEEELPHFLSMVEEEKEMEEEEEEEEAKRQQTAHDDLMVVDEVLQSKRTRELFSQLLQMERQHDDGEARLGSVEGGYLSKAAVVAFLATAPDKGDIFQQGRPTPPIWELASTLLWVECCIKHEEFRTILHEMQTESAMHVTKEELDAFGRVCQHLYPSDKQVSVREDATVD